MHMKNNEVIVKTDIADRPEDHELSAALILANHFKTNVIFLRPQKSRTPDIRIRRELWEIKSPRGDGKRTIDNNFRTARTQSHNIIIDLRRIKMNTRKAISRINHYLSAGSHGFKKVLIIDKKGNVIEVL